jgi:hypothetical protein
MTDDPRATGRREFLKVASLLAAAAACGPTPDRAPSPEAGGRPAAAAPRRAGFDDALLASVGATVLPSSLGTGGQRAAVAAFVAWCDGYEPVAEEMHGYGYADIRYLPADPVPAWRAQLDGLDVLAERVHHARFTSLDLAQREAIIAMALRESPGEGMPSPLGAGHVAVALLAHWSASPEAWNRALGVVVSPETCRPLANALRKPLPVARS